MEKWLPVEVSEGPYEVSDLGQVRSLDRIESIKNRWGGTMDRIKRGRVLTPRVRDRGYLAVSFKRGGKDYPIHHLVLNAFVYKRPDGFVANHKNGVKTDNRVENLEWCTHKENRQHSIKTGLSRSNKGQKWNQLSRQDVIEIRKEFGMSLSSILAKKFNVTQSTISRIGLRRSHKNI